MNARLGAGLVAVDWPCTASDLDVAAAWMRAMRRGDFEAAWALGDRELTRPRPLDAVARPRHVQRIWDGRPVDGRRVLVRCHHGLGDTIQFARFLPALAARAGSVVVWAQPALLALLATMGAPVEYLPLHDDAPDTAFDVDVEIMELPWVLRCTLATLPARVPYLHVAPRSRPAGDDRLAVGIAWRGGDWDRSRDVHPSLLAPIAALPGVRAMALEAWPTPADRAAWIGEWPPVEGLMALAGVVASLDLVISVDTMCAHLAGALGVPVWTLLQHEADWRWMEGRDDSPWYPTMRLFRQTRADDWPALAERVRDACADLPRRAGQGR
jgi:hypothetical protein